MASDLPISDLRLDGIPIADAVGSVRLSPVGPDLVDFRLSAIASTLPAHLANTGTVQMRVGGQRTLFGIFHASKASGGGRGRSVRLAGNASFGPSDAFDPLATAGGDAATDQAAAGATRSLDTTASTTGPAGGLDIRALASTDGNRWNEPDQPTIYLAGDPAVALAELGRHLGSGAAETAIWEVRVRLDAVVDLRAAGEYRGSARSDPSWVLDPPRARNVANAFRDRGDCDGILVPSVAFLDDPERWNLVVFLERLRRPLDEAIVPGQSLGVWQTRP